MLSNIWIIPALPLAGFLTLGLLGLWRLYRTGRRLSRPLVYWIGCGVVGLAFLVSVVCFVELLGMDPEHRVYESDLFTWIPGNVIQTAAGESVGLHVSWGYQFDPLSAIFSPLRHGDRIPDPRLFPSATCGKMTVSGVSLPT